MNFKNISLFSLLFVAGFVGTTVPSEKAYLMPISEEKKVEYGTRILEALLVSKKARLTASEEFMQEFDAILGDAKNECSRILEDGDYSRDDIEICGMVSGIEKDFQKYLDENGDERDKLSREIKGIKKQSLR